MKKLTAAVMGFSLVAGLGTASADEGLLQTKPILKSDTSVKSAVGANSEMGSAKVSVTENNRVEVDKVSLHKIETKIVDTRKELVRDFKRLSDDKKRLESAEASASAEIQTEVDKDHEVVAKDIERLKNHLEKKVAEDKAVVARYEDRVAADRKELERKTKKVEEETADMTAAQEKNDQETVDKLKTQVEADKDQLEKQKVKLDARVEARDNMKVELDRDRKRQADVNAHLNADDETSVNAGSGDESVEMSSDVKADADAKAKY